MREFMFSALAQWLCPEESGYLKKRKFYPDVPKACYWRCNKTIDMKPEKLAFMPPVTTRASQQRQGLNLCGYFIQMPVT